MTQPQNALPFPFHSTSTPLALVAQGAEALVYRTTFLTTSTPCALKVRPSKAYRHPTLDARLTRTRILAEARVLVKCAREGVPVPAVLAMGWEEGWIAMEWIEGRTVRAWLNWYLKRMEERGDAEYAKDATLRALMAGIGSVLAQLHGLSVIHGDLTTSNLILREENDNEQAAMEGKVVLIDFGLTTQSIQDEDRAVDLYVLERAFLSTHPQAQELFQQVLSVYSENLKGGKIVLKRLEEVRQRGRKKSMLG